MNEKDRKVKKELTDKWNPILDSLDSLNHLDDEKKSWLGQYAANIGSQSNIPIITATQSQPSNPFPSLFPMVKGVFAQTIANQLVSVQPIGSPFESDEDKAERLRKIRDSKIEAILKETKWELPEELEPPSGGLPVGKLFYLDYQYGTSSTTNTTVLGKKKKKDS